MPERRPVDFRLAAERFDPDWYRREHADVEAAVARGESALNHYVEFGAGEGRRPNQGFSPEWYLEHYPMVRPAIAAGRVVGAFHDYLGRARQGTPRRAGPATAVVGATVGGADAALVSTLLCLAARAPGWEFWVVAPPGRLPPDPAGPNVRFVASEDEMPAIDIRIDFGDPDAAPAGIRIALGPLMESLGHPPADRSAAALDAVLERLREQLLAACPVIPAGRRDSGPVHVDRDRIRQLRLTVRSRGPAAAGGGVVLRMDGRTVAEVAPTASGTTVLDLAEKGGLWVSVSAGQSVELSAADLPAADVDVILVGSRAAGVGPWRASARSATELRPGARLLLVRPPPGLQAPAAAAVMPDLATALASRDVPALLVPAGVELFPQAVNQALDMLAGGIDRSTARSAMRHPDGHLVSWSPGALDHDAEHLGRWARASVTLLSGAARRDRTVRAPIGPAAALGAVDATAWPAGLAPQPSRAPDWLELDCRPDGSVVGRLRLRGGRFVAGGRIVISGNVSDALGEPCEVVAAVERRRSGGGPMGSLMLPQTGGFAWPIDLPEGLRAGDTIAIAPAGRWITAQAARDPRPVLFRLESVRYRPPSTSPSAASRSR